MKANGPTLIDFIYDHHQPRDNRKLNLINCQIRRLDPIPQHIANEIQIIFASNNYISSIQHIDQFTNLRVLSLSSNNIKYLDDIDILSKLVFLEKLSLQKNPVAFIPFYREYTIFICPRLEVLDDRKISAQDRQEAPKVITKLNTLFEQGILIMLRITILTHIELMWKCSKMLRKEILPKYR